MYTVDRLLTIAYDTFEHLREEQAIWCAEWMDRNGITEVPSIGPFYDGKFPKKGEKIKIKAGSVIKNSGTGEENVSERVRNVTAVYSDNGTVFLHTSPIRIMNATVTWVGAGGNYMSTDLTNVEF